MRPPCSGPHLQNTADGRDHIRAVAEERGRSVALAVCIPTYNGTRHIAACVQSVLAQKDVDMEVLAVDDRSEDDTHDRLLTWAPLGLSVRVNAERLGLVGNWNRCLNLARGEYVCVFHQDDIMLPGNLARKIGMLDAHPNLGFAFSSMKTIDGKGRVIGGHWTKSLPSTDTIFAGHDFLDLMLSAGNVVPCQSVVMRTSCVRSAGYFDSRLHYTPDFDMWLRLALYADVAYLVDPLVAVRRHSDQESVRFLGQPEEILETWRAISILFSEHANRMRSPEVSYTHALDHLGRWSFMLARNAARRGESRQAASCLMFAARFAWMRRRGLAALLSSTTSEGSA